MKVKSKITVKLIIAVLIAMISIFGLSKMMSKPETYQKTIESLQSKISTVTALSTASTAASVTIAMVPEDWTNPISDELAELSSLFLLILSAIYLEKYLLTIIGFVIFSILVPACCGVYIANLFFQREIFKIIMRKILIISVVCLCVIPVSEKISNLINETNADSIEFAIETAQSEVEKAEEEKGGITEFFSNITDSATELLEWAKNVLSNFTEAVAIMIVTCCIIPVLVIIFMFWFIKYMLGLNINLPKVENLMLVKRGIHKIQEKRYVSKDDFEE